MQRIATIALLAVLMAGTAALAQMRPLPTTHEVEGTVKKIDAMAKTVEVSRLLGLMATKLEVTSDTQIRVDGKDVTLTDLREGARIKASYESQAGKNVARSIEVQPEEKKQPAASPPTGPGTRPTPKTQ